MCFQNDGKNDQAVRGIKSRISTNVIDSVLLIDTFEKKCVVIKCMLQPLRLKDNVKTIGIEQSLRKNYIYEHKFLQNIKNVYKHAGKCDDQQQFKDIIEAAMVSIPEGFTNNSPISPMTSTPFNKPSARKSQYLFTNILDLKKKTATRQFGKEKSKHKEIKAGTAPWEFKQKRKRNSKIND